MPTLFTSMACAYFCTVALLIAASPVSAAPIAALAQSTEVSRLSSALFKNAQYRGREGGRQERGGRGRGGGDGLAIGIGGPYYRRNYSL